MRLRRSVPLALVGYLIGSVSFARLVSRRAGGTAGAAPISVNLPGGAAMDYTGVSATSVAVESGPRWGIITGLLDTAKAFVPTLLAKRFLKGRTDHLVVATAVIVGHNYPLYHRFKGGRGQTAFYGGVMAIDWPAIPVTTAAGTVLGLSVMKDMLAAYTIGMWLTVPWFLWRRKPAEAVYALVANGLFLVAMIPETKAYLEKRRQGEVAKLSSWGEFLKSYPAMRRGEPAGPAGS